MRQDLLAAIQEFNRERDWEQFHVPKNLAMALAAEAGELLEPFLWLTTRESHRLDKRTTDQVREEIGDVLICLINLADKLGIDPIQAAWRKLELNRVKYPAKTVRGKSHKYDRYARKVKPKIPTHAGRTKRVSGRRQADEAASPKGGG